MAASIECPDADCPEYGIEKRALGGADIDMTVPTLCGGCGSVLVEGDGVEIGGGPTNVVPAE